MSKLRNKKRKEIKEDNYYHGLYMGENIHIEDSVKVGRVPVPFERQCPRCGEPIIGGMSYHCSNCGYLYFSAFSDIVF